MDHALGERTGMRFEVTVAHDPERGVYTVAGSTLPGLVAEDASLEGLSEKIRDMAPALLAAIGVHRVGQGGEVVPVA